VHHMEKASIALFLSVKLLPQTVRGLSYARKFANFRISWQYVPISGGK
jgi:hypothetical protein